MIQKMPVVLDTNVLVSALWSENGVPAKILHMVPYGAIMPIYSAEILQEYGTVLNRPSFKFLPGQVDGLLQKFVQHGRLVLPERSSIPLPDESDRVFYDTATTGSAILITGNAKHFPDEPFIMSPSDFYRYLLEKNKF